MFCDLFCMWINKDVLFVSFVFWVLEVIIKIDVCIIVQFLIEIESFYFTPFDIQYKCMSLFVLLLWNEQFCIHYR